jgi:2-polyprenyl-3-methyl-5-hydroxy-6-metoxy-1,4-benzoquinol methylase
MTEDTRDLFYKNYADWKSWGGPEDLHHDTGEFEVEIRRAETPPGATVLEVGFGEGAFLDWARGCSYRIVGVDINPDMVHAAKRRGHEVYLGDARNLLQDFTEKFDAIVCLDVLEHLTLQEIVDLFSVLATVLKPEGRIVARFPNGASPFGRLYQHGDATHMTTLTGPLMDQIAMTAGMKVLGEYNAARPVRGTDRKGIKNNVLVRKLAFLTRDVFNAILSLLYFGRVVPFDPEMTVVIGRA